jgi:NADH-quinone oxidoreductase subunit J
VTLETVGFWAVAIVLLASSLAVVLTPNLFHAVLFLAGALVATGLVFLLLDAAFLFGVQLLLYAGGVVTILVFAIMLTERLVGERITQASRFIANGAVVSAAVFVGIAGLLIRSAGRPEPAPAQGDAVTAIAHALTGGFAASFELLGVLLVAALLGAIYFARTED